MLFRRFKAMRLTAYTIILKVKLRKFQKAAIERLSTKNYRYIYQG